MHVQSNGGWLGGWLGGRLGGWLAGRPKPPPPPPAGWRSSLEVTIMVKQVVHSKRAQHSGKVVYDKVMKFFSMQNNERRKKTR